VAVELGPLEFVGTKEHFLSYRCSPQIQAVLDIERGYAVAQLVEALPSKSEGRGFDSR
jgi:hypothetical protein